MNNAAENKDQTAYLRLMLDAFEKIKSFIGDMSCDTFFIDSKTQSAVIMQLQVVGELVKKVDENIKDKISIPWKDMAGLRDMVAHQYFHLDLPSIWTSATEDIAGVEKEIKKYLAK